MTTTTMMEPTAPSHRKRGEKSGLVPIQKKALGEIYPAPENEQLYRPILPEDPATVALADSIRQHGIREPLVVTLDGWILSGHRRYVAAQLAGLVEVPCRVEPINRLINLRMSGRGEINPEFVALLREHNRQRVKTLDEALREEVVSADPEEAYESLLDYRRRVSEVDAVEIMEIPKGRRRSKISNAKMPFLEAVLAAISKLKPIWPVSDRKIHYTLLDDPPLRHASKPGSRYANTLQSYKALVDLLTRARMDGTIPWNVIADDTRPVTTWTIYRNAQDFIRQQLDEFLKGYWRDLMQSQPNHVEITGEKVALKGTIHGVAAEYCIPYTLGRGFCSSPPREAMARRFRDGGKEKLVILFLTDFDPAGEAIAESFAQSMRRDFGIENIVPVKVALTVDQVKEFKLPPGFEPMKAKEKSSTYRKFVEKYKSDTVFEIDALGAESTQAILRDAIDSIIDVDAFNAELDAERADAEFLENMRRRLKAALAGVVADPGGGDE